MGFLPRRSVVGHIISWKVFCDYCNFVSSFKQRYGSLEADYACTAIRLVFCLAISSVELALPYYDDVDARCHIEVDNTVNFRCLDIVRVIKMSAINIPTKCGDIA